MSEKTEKKAPDKEEPKIGVYVCNCGGNIGDVVECSKVAKMLEKLPNVVTSHSHMFMCSDPGQKLIADDIKEKGVNRVVVGACSIFLHEQTFRQTVERAGLNPYLYYHIGLREQDSWVHHNCHEEATEKAIRMMSAGIAKARLMQPLEAIKLKANKKALVIGGGVAGLRSALDIARREIDVTLIEKSHFLGGHMTQWDNIFPTNENARTLINQLIKEVIANPRITIHTGAEVISTKGYVGNFDIRIKQMPRGIQKEIERLNDAITICPIEVPDEFNFGLNKRKALYMPYAGCTPTIPAIDWDNCTKCGECLKYSQDNNIMLDSSPIEFDINVGAVVIATGFKPYEPQTGELGFGELPEVITLPQLERLLSKDGPTNGRLEWNGHPVRSMAMVHCVGSRQVDGVHNPQPDGQVNNYCSRVCCTATLSAANHIREQYPNLHIYDIYEDIRTYGRGHEDYYTQAGKNRVIFLRYFAEEMPEVEKAPKGDEYPVIVRVKDHLTYGNEIEIPVDLVVLAVGMMPNPVQDLVDLFKISSGNDRFLLEVHPKLRPVETEVTGIILSGSAQAPMNIQESCSAAGAAASKVAVLLSQGQVKLEPYIAQVNLDLCNGSGECVEYCPQEEAISLETLSINGKAVKKAVVTAANCNGCGVCVSVCPNRAIDVQGWKLDEFEAMVDAITAEIQGLGVGT